MQQYIGSLKTSNKVLCETIIWNNNLWWKTMKQPTTMMFCNSLWAINFLFFISMLIISCLSPILWYFLFQYLSLYVFLMNWHTFSSHSYIWSSVFKLETQWVIKTKTKDIDKKIMTRAGRWSSKLQNPWDMFTKMMIHLLNPFFTELYFILSEVSAFSKHTFGYTCTN